MVDRTGGQFLSGNDPERTGKAPPANAQNATDRTAARAKAKLDVSFIFFRSRQNPMPTPRYGP
jgi:hypothetical protein